MIGQGPLSRRTVLASLGALPLVPLATDAEQAITPSSSATTAPGLRPAPAATDVSRVEQFVRMRCAPRGGWSMWAYSGVLVLKPEGQVARPVTRVEGFSFNRAVPRGAGEYLYELDEVGYYCDLATGAVLEEWTNPFTGSQVRPAHYRSPLKTLFSGVHVVPTSQLPPGTEFRGEITTLAEVGGLVAMTEDLYVRLPGRPADGTQPARPDRISASLATHTARAEDLARPAADWVDCWLHYGTMNSFPGWLGMNGMPGVQNMRLVGRKLQVTQLEMLPPWLLERVRRDHPTFLSVATT